jgi:hypothetical protein
VVVVEVVECLSCRYLYDGLMMGGNDGPVNRCVCLEEEGRMHWPVQEKVDALPYSFEAAESESHLV